MRATLVFLFLILAKGETSAQSLPSVFPFKTRKTINIGVFFVRDNPSSTVKKLPAREGVGKKRQPRQFGDPNVLIKIALLPACISTGVISSVYNLPQYIWGFTTANELANAPRFPTVVIMTPNYFTLSLALLSVMDHFGWTEFAFIYSGDESSERCPIYLSDLQDAPSWDFANSVFFTTTMLTSIGYGYVAPNTFGGRLFGVIYCLIGIPLTLVTVANVAKFISETIFLIHYELWKYWCRWKAKRKGQELNNEPLFAEDEDEQEILDRVKLVRFPPIVVFLFVFLYGLLASYIIQRKEQWSYVESMYFTFISILTGGRAFGSRRKMGVANDALWIRALCASGK
ncbi:hypothetical protein Y032_0004g1740 [Ancylostoma ceylanicum]|uniref:Ion channel n=1 Tax=Ancylostoma ceylanicum TaxID=53326 RepID=A0A016VT13_9BILA|nr:hypothetical protein Y032_0004g1740 [Ancylostoma ceylanicum]